MPNRILKESICTSDNLNELCEEAENFFYRLLVCCDDFGRFDGRVAIVNSRCYPLRTKSTDTIKSLMGMLQDKGIIAIYEVDGKPFIQMVTWEKHQQIRAKKSKFPAPVCELISNDIRCNQAQANVTVIQSNPIRIQSESESESTSEQLVKMTRAEFVELYQTTFGKMMSGGLNYDCDEILKTYTPDRIKDAFSSAASAGASSFNYIKTVLKGEPNGRSGLAGVAAKAGRKTGIIQAGGSEADWLGGAG